MVSTRSKTQGIATTIVVPAYKERDNLKPLVERIFRALGPQGLSTEIIVVDDNSRDGSEEVVNELTKTYPTVRIIVRTKERGLSSAVLRGFNEARGNLLLCMDADLQHPPESVPDMINVLGQTEFVIGTRYGNAEFAVDKDWPLYRRVISQGARALAIPLTPLSDPMTGFFGIQKSVYENGKHISPIGFKIAMELYVKCHVKKHGEVPIHFGVRAAGESKLSSKVIINYLAHLWQLYLYKLPLVLLMLFVVAILALYYLSTVLLF